MPGRDNLLNGDLPYSRECKSCVIAASRGRAHKRIPHADAYTLSIDIAGPFMLAEDQLGKGRFVLVGVYLVPVTKNGHSLIPIHEEDELPGAEGDGPGLTVVEDEGDDHDRGEPWPGLDDEKEWASLVESEQDFQAKQVTFAEVMENRGASAVLEAVGRMVAKLNFLGLPLVYTLIAQASIRVRCSTGGYETEGCVTPLQMATTSRATAVRKERWHSSNVVHEPSWWQQASMRAIGATPQGTGPIPDFEANWSRWGGSGDSWCPSARWFGRRGSSIATDRSTCLPPGRR